MIEITLFFLLCSGVIRDLHPWQSAVPSPIQKLEGASAWFYLCVGVCVIGVLFLAWLADKRRSGRSASERSGEDE